MKRTDALVSLNSGLLAPRKYDKISFSYKRIDNHDTVNMGYYSGGIFLHRVQTTYDSEGRELTIELFQDEGPFA